MIFGVHFLQNEWNVVLLTPLTGGTNFMLHRLEHGSDWIVENFVATRGHTCWRSVYYFKYAFISIQSPWSLSYMIVLKCTSIFVLTERDKHIS